MVFDFRTPKIKPRMIRNWNGETSVLDFAKNYLDGSFVSCLGTVWLRVKREQKWDNAFRKLHLGNQAIWLTR